jgi:hypothetical protein
MPQSNVTYMGQKVFVACDGKCEKAWGINNRPKNQLSDDGDDYEFLADGELPIAPIDPGTYEGDDAKPPNATFFPNRWCVRECERCVMEDRAEDIVLPDFSKRQKNVPDDPDDE